MLSDFDAGAWAMVSYIYNTSGDQFARDAYGEEHHPSYLAEKASTWASSPARALGFLGAEQRARIFTKVRKEAVQMDVWNLQ